MRDPTRYAAQMPALRLSRRAAPVVEKRHAALCQMRRTVRIRPLISFFRKKSSPSGASIERFRTGMIFLFGILKRMERAVRSAAKLDAARKTSFEILETFFAEILFESEIFLSGNPLSKKKPSASAVFPLPLLAAKRASPRKQRVSQKTKSQPERLTPFAPEGGFPNRLTCRRAR